MSTSDSIPDRLSDSYCICDRLTPYEAERAALRVMHDKFEADPELARACKSNLPPQQREARLNLLRRLGYINPEAMLDGTPEYREVGRATKGAEPEEILVAERDTQVGHPGYVQRTT